ncbi:TPA: hypothetical protein TXN53_000899 [Streptococcus suis]|uniref:hypothetical protein n=1 Tax=Streptococcus suis TaxID=1307 RepID=UPI002A78DA77|nr:hypothetical protein [Streptococcus suis]HEM2740859.1 hypothetical protein [Streptococcus suis]HEP1798568.1 hypothetical protein [Streptococcus suis]
MTIVAEICEILKSSVHLAEFDKSVMQLMSQLLTRSARESLERLDKEIIQSYLSDGWEIDRLEERQLTFLFGMVSFKRRRLRKAGEKSFLPLDKVAISMRQVLKKLPHEPHRVPQASIALNGATSTSIGQLKKWI